MIFLGNIIDKGIYDIKPNNTNIIICDNIHNTNISAIIDFNVASLATHKQI